MKKKLLLGLPLLAVVFILFFQGLPRFLTRGATPQVEGSLEDEDFDLTQPSLQDLPEPPADVAEPVSELFEPPPSVDETDDISDSSEPLDHLLDDPDQSRKEKIKEKRKVKALSSSLDSEYQEEGFDVNSPATVASPDLPGDQEYGYAPSGAGVNPALLPGSSPEETASPEPSPSPLLDNSQARGYTILNLMQTQARDTVEAQLQNVIEAKIKRIYLGVLVDGTFSWDEAYFDRVVQRLNEDGRELTLVMYMTNGSTMRNAEETDIQAGFNTINPITFRNLIRYDPRTRAQYQSLVRRSLRIFARNRTLNENNKNIIIPMLEDNLDAQSYVAMRQLTREISGNIAEIYRNPCMKINPRVGCYAGNDEVTFGDAVEYHIPEELSRLDLDDGFSLDGTGYKFNFEFGVRGISEAQVGQLLDETSNRGVAYFGLWRFDRQGLHETDEVPIHPDDRDYTVPTLEHLRRERALLRRGFEEPTSGDDI